MAKITDLSSMSDITWQAVKIQQQMQKLYSLTLPPPAIQQLMKSVEKISQITDPPAIRAIQDSMNVITKLNSACNLPWSNAFNAISQIPLDVRTDLAESLLQQLDPVEISHTDVPDVTEEQEKQIDELFPTLKDKSLSRDAIITLIALLFNLLCTFAGCEMESISHEDNIQSHRDAIQAHKDAVQAHEDAVQAHRDFSQSQSIENNNAALQTQISKNTSLDGANDDD